MMEQYKDFVVTHTCLPVFLADLLQTDEDILLVHCNKEAEELSVTFTDKINFSSNSTMNLTGAPLEVDLNVLPSAAAYHLLRHQSSGEAKHIIPMKLGIARKFIHDYKMNSKELAMKPKAIYCVCDGNDEKHIVVLGSYQLGGDVVRTLVFLEDCVNQTYPENFINSMVQKHVENVGTNTVKIETKVTCVYELYGFKLSNNYVLEDLENTGSVIIEGCWNSVAYNIPQYGAAIKMMLQVIIGHENSIMYPFFQELVFLQHCLKILSNKQGILDDAIISFSSLDIADVNKGISDALHEVNVTRKPSTAVNNLQDAIQSISDTKILGKLYTVLKSCQTVSDLRICFDRLFEIVSDTPVRLQIFDDDDKNTVVGKMINDVNSGKMIIPNLSSKQSLELLMELGIQKLKKNYLYIIKSCDFTIGEQLIQNWSNLRSCSTESRRTFVELDLRKSCLQLHFLLCVHVLLEFLQLVEQNCCFSKYVSLCLMKHAYNKYVMENSSMELSMMERKQLCDLIVPLTFADVKLIEGCSPVKWQIKMSSVQKNSSATTVFHYSKNPIFPDTVYKSYEADVSSIDGNEKFFVARLERYSDKIF